MTKIDNDVIETVGCDRLGIDIERAYEGRGYWLILRAYDRSGGLDREVELVRMRTLRTARRRAEALYEQITKGW